MKVLLVSDNSNKIQEWKFQIQNHCKGSIMVTTHDILENHERELSFEDFPVGIIELTNSTSSLLNTLFHNQQKSTGMGMQWIALVDNQNESLLPRFFEAGGSDYIKLPLGAFDVEWRILPLIERKQGSVSKNSFWNRLDLVMESANAGMFQYTVQNNQLIWDDRSYEIFGYVGDYKTQFSGVISDWYSRLHPNEAKRAEKEFENALQGTASYFSLHFSIVKPNEEEGFIMVSAIIERDERGQALQVLGFHFDLTELHTARRAQIESEKEYRTLTDSLHEIVWKSDLGGNFIYVNPAFEKIFGYKWGAEHCPSASELFTPQSLESLLSRIDSERKKLEQNERRNNHIRFELEGVTKDGGFIYLETSADFILNGKGEPIGIQGVMRETTLQKKQQREIEKYQNHLEQMVSEQTRELKESQDELELIFDHAPVVMMLLSRNRTVININKTGLSFAGKSKDEIKNQSFASVFGCCNLREGSVCGTLTECDNCHIQKIIEKAFNERKDQSKIETVLVTSNRGKYSRFDVLVSSTLIYSKGQDCVLLIIDNISEEKRVKEQLIESEEKYRKLFETKNEAVFFLYADSFKYFDANQAAISLYGYSMDELVGMTPIDISIEKENTYAVLSEVASSGGIKSHLQRHCRHKNGNRLIVEIKNSLIMLNGRKVICSTHHDITQHKQAEIAIKKSEQMFRMLVESIDDIFWLFDVSARKLKYMSPQRERMLGFKPDDMFDNYVSFIENAHPADKDRIYKQIHSFMKGEKVTIDYRSITAYGEVRWLQFKSFGFFEAGDEKDLIFGIVSDITDQRMSERKVLHAILETENREREAFAKELHDGLGATLSSIKMSLEMLNSASVREEKKQFYSQYSLELITQAADIAREISHNLKPHVLANLGLLSSIKILTEKITSLGRIKIQFKHKDCETRKFDEEVELAIYRITSELCNNSIKYANASSADVVLIFDGKRLVLTYSDDGRGFDTEKVLSEKGSGLKNIIARVEALGGEVDIQSQIDNGMTAVISVNVYADDIATMS